MKEVHQVIDGTDPYGCYTGDPREAVAPWVVFDIREQRFVAGPFRFRWMASLWLLFKGRKA